MSIQKQIEELNLNSAIIDAKEKIKKTGYKYDDKHQAVIEANDENGLLPDGISLKQLNAMIKHRSQFVSGLALEVADSGPDYLKKHKDADSVTLIGKYGNDKIEVTMKRNADVRNVATGETHTVYGAMNAKYRAYGCNGSSGSLKTIRSFASKAAEAILK